MLDILFIQPWDRPWDDRASVIRRRRMAISRAQFEVGLQVPDAYSFACLDLNLALRSNDGTCIEDLVGSALAAYHPAVILCSWPAFVLGGQMKRILSAIVRSGQRPQVVLGGSAVGLVHDLPMRWWPTLTCCSNGYGGELPDILSACLARKRLNIPGVYWRDEGATWRPQRGAVRLPDDYRSR